MGVTSSVFRLLESVGPQRGYNTAEAPHCGDESCNSSSPDCKGYIYHPRRSHANTSQEEGKDVPRGDVHIVPRILGHGVRVQAPHLHLSQGESHDVLYAQGDYESRMAKGFHLVDLKRQPEGK